MMARRLEAHTASQVPKFARAATDGRGVIAATNAVELAIAPQAWDARCSDILPQRQLRGGPMAQVAPYRLCREPGKIPALDAHRLVACWKLPKLGSPWHKAIRAALDRVARADRTAVEPQ